MPPNSRQILVQRRTTIPQELEDPEDSVIGAAQGDLFEPQSAAATTATAATATPSTTTNMATPPASPPGLSSVRSLPLALPSTPTQPSIASADDDDSSSSSLFSWRFDAWPREFRNLMAGGLAGMAAKSVVAPMDRIKILYQVSSAEFHLRAIPGVVRNILEQEGWTALWKGNTATMIRVFPYSGIQFMVFDRCKRHFLHQHHHHPIDQQPHVQSTAPAPRRHGLTALESLLSGMIAGTISVVCTYPLDLTRAQLAVLKQHRSHNKGFITVLTENYTLRGGVKGLFRGISPTLLGILPYSGIAFTLNEQGKRKIQNLAHRELTTMERMQCGAVAGLFAQSATYPIEVTRRRMQTLGLVGNDTAFSCLKSNNATAAAAAVDRPESLTSTIRHLYAEQGIRGFFKGVSMNWMKGPVAFSISFTTFDTIQGWMESEEERAQRFPTRFSMQPKER